MSNLDYYPDLKEEEAMHMMRESKIEEVQNLKLLEDKMNRIKTFTELN